MNLFDFTLQTQGFPISEAKRKLAGIQQIPEVAYQNYISEARKKIVEFHIKNNDFYKNFIGNIDFEKWENIPILKKSDLQKPLAQRLSNGFSEKNVYINKTSGSSGTPFIFAKDRFSHALTWAENMDRVGWYGIDFNTHLQARFYGIPLDFFGYRKERLKDFLAKRYRFPVFDLSEEKMEHFLNIFRRKKFQYINGYTSAIVYFAKFLKRKNIVLNEICPSLNYCIVTSEMLFEEDKIVLENAFGVPVVNEYGASELDLIAFTNKRGEFILNSETLFVEILDENNIPVKHGKSGRVIITSLYNKAHPMIRYEIGDTGILAEESTFKKPILKRLVGRTNDLAKLPSGKTVPGLSFYYVTKSIIEDDGNVKEFVVEQTALDAFKITYVSEKELVAEEIAKIENALFSYLENGLKITFERVAILIRNNRGKLKQFVSSL
ncbi:phenylacetate--CoA ligase family protein [Aequorivita echinoideorum]|uniref:Phenylacetate--CoA ligase family protein n=1 Tax=Aequorivita echinoideorum TaxID=1549647 RepID=A0ABS5S423_9FLAO|nr:phenylacetate--CoA ligase family protein [Aequorivita echinoideorum]MBT0607169.1 phenylacetate--CoA ligase family protein [Aequorivita echinoideorum]